MSKNEQPKPQAPAAPEAAQPARRERERGPRYTHLVGRSASQRNFTRAGITFTPQLQAWPLDQLDEERVRRIMNESMVIAQLATEEDLEKLDIAARAELDESIPRTALVEHIKHLELRCSRLEERVEQMMNERLADRPPRRADEIKAAT